MRGNRDRRVGCPFFAILGNSLRSSKKIYGMSFVMMAMYAFEGMYNAGHKVWQIIGFGRRPIQDTWARGSQWKKWLYYILKPPYGDHKFRFQKPKKGSKIDPPKNPENALIGRIVGVESLGPKNSPDFVPAFGISGFRGSKKPIFGGFRMKKVRDEGTPKNPNLSKFIVILKNSNRKNGSF